MYYLSSSKNTGKTKSKFLQQNLEYLTNQVILTKGMERIDASQRFELWVVWMVWIAAIGLLGYPTKKSSKDHPGPMELAV